MLGKVEFLGAGTNEAHVAFEDVEKLRKLVQVGRPEEPADRGDSRVISGNQVNALVRPDLHGSELVHRELPCLPSYPSLPKDDGTIGGQPYGNGYGDEQRKAESEDDKRQRYIKHPFGFVVYGAHSLFMHGCR